MGGFSVFFQFLALVQILRVNCNEMDGELKIDQDNLRTVTARLSRVSWALLRLLVRRVVDL